MDDADWEKQMNKLPPLNLNDYSMEKLMEIGAVSKISFKAIGPASSRYTNWDWVQAHGRAQSWDITAVAIDQWVPLGASLREMQKASGGGLDPLRILDAIKRKAPG